jgi:hypothetical protein
MFTRYLSSTAAMCCSRTGGVIAAKAALRIAKHQKFALRGDGSFQGIRIKDKPA